MLTLGGGWEHCVTSYRFSCEMCWGASILSYHCIALVSYQYQQSPRGLYESLNSLPSQKLCTLVYLATFCCACDSQQSFWLKQINQPHHPTCMLPREGGGSDCPQFIRRSLLKKTSIMRHREKWASSSSFAGWSFFGFRLIFRFQGPKSQKWPSSRPKSIYKQAKNG